MAGLMPERDFRLITTCPLAKRLLAEINAQPGLWNTRTERRDSVGSPHRAMSDIWLRYNAIERLGPEFNNEHVPVNYPAWQALPAARKICFWLMAMVEGEMLGGVLITKIPPGGQILPHLDKGWHVEYYSKFYVSLSSAPGAVFATASQEICPKPGEVHLFDNRKLHWVDNQSEVDRISLIVCIRTNKEGFSSTLGKE
jgi:hypothetical protein